MKFILAIVMWLLLAGVANATWHLYVVPVVGQGTELDERRGKYIENAVRSSCTDYGFQPVMLCAMDVDATADAFIIGQPDVTKLPDNLDSTIPSAGLATVQAALENRNIPAGWVTAGLTYRALLRTVNGFFAFMQRYVGVTGKTGLVLGGSITLNTQFNELSQTLKNELALTAQSLGLDTSQLSGNNTIRQILKNIADQWGQRSFVLGGITI